MIFVEDCQNWKSLFMDRGANCWNCGLRDGYPFRGQPDKKCKNFKIIAFYSPPIWFGVFAIENDGLPLPLLDT